MKVLKKVVSISLASVLLVGNIGPVLANPNINPISRASSIEKEESKMANPDNITENTKRNDQNDEILDKDNLSGNLPKENSAQDEPSYDLAKDKEVAGDQEKVIYKNLRVKIDLHGLCDEEFSLDKISPKLYKLEFTYRDKNTNRIETISRGFTEDGQVLDFGKFPKEAVENGILSLKRNSDDTNKVIEEYSLGELENKDFILYKIYQVQSTKISVRTITSDGNLTANPTNLHFTYRLLDKVKKGEIPFDSEEIDVLEDDAYTFDLDNGENIYDGREKPELSLDMSENGYVFDGDFAYKIVKEEQKNEDGESDRSKPLEVTLIKKAKLIKSVSQPTYTDPDTGEEILDDDYVRMADKNTQDEENQSNYWILKTDEDLFPEENDGDGEKEKTEKKEGFLANDISICAGDEIVTDLLLKNPTDDYSPITKAILKKDGFENGKVIYGENGEIEVEILDFLYLEDINSYSVRLRVAVDPSYGKKVRRSNQILRDEADPLNPISFINQPYQLSLVDENGNNYDFENQIIIKNQNTKADLIPEKIQLEKGGILAQTKQKIRPQDIIDRVKNGRWQNKKSVNESYANQTMAVKKAPSFVANSIEPKLAANPFMLDEEKFNQIDWDEPGVYEVPVTVAWIDGSTSIVNVPVEVVANDVVITGIFDTGYGIGLMLAGLGLLAGAISLYNLNRKKAYF